ncbi:DNA-directed DNA polymerase [Tanacetum coccineum]
MRRLKAKCGWKGYVLAFDKRKSNVSIATNTGHFGRECKFKGTDVRSRQRRRKQIHIMHFKLSSMNELQYGFGDQLIDCGMSSTVKIGLGYGIKSNAEVLGYEEEISRELESKQWQWDLGAGILFDRKTIVLCVESLSHLNKDCDYLWRRKMERSTRADPSLLCRPGGIFEDYRAIRFIFALCLIYGVLVIRDRCEDCILVMALLRGQMLSFLALQKKSWKFTRGQAKPKKGSFISQDNVIVAEILRSLLRLCKSLQLQLLYGNKGHLWLTMKEFVLFAIFRVNQKGVPSRCCKRVFKLHSRGKTKARLMERQHLGGCQFLGRRLISLAVAKKQTIVATSTTEVESWGLLLWKGMMQAQLANGKDCQLSLANWMQIGYKLRQEKKMKKEEKKRGKWDEEDAEKKRYPLTNRSAFTNVGFELVQKKGKHYGFGADQICGAHMMIRASTTSSGPFNQTFQNTKRSCHTKEVPCKDGCLLDIASYIMQNDMHTVIMESLVKKKQKGVILELKRRHLKNTIFCTYTPYPAMKIRRISASSAQETRNDQFSIRHLGRSTTPKSLTRAFEKAHSVNYEIKGVTTRGGKTTIEATQKTNITNKPPTPNHDDPITPPESEPKKTLEKDTRPKISHIPFPQRLKKEKEEAQQRKFLQNLKQLQLSIPFTEALAQMPKYAKFLKSLMSNKTRLEEAYTVTMNEICSAVLLNKLPLKEKDPGSFTIPCDIGNLHIDNALADLGANISLMPYSMYEKLGLGEPKPTRMSLELADRSIQYPRGIAKNLLIKVDKFVLPIDFVILDMREDTRIPIILVRPFLATARAMIDVFNKRITLRVGDEEVIFDVDQSIKKSPTDDDE